MAVAFRKMNFSYPCGLSECEYPQYYCESDLYSPSRSRCLPCSDDVCSTLGTKYFPKICTLYCNPNEALLGVCNGGQKGEDDTFIPMYCPSGLLFISIVLNIILVVVISYYIWTLRKRMIMWCLSWRDKEKMKGTEYNDPNKETYLKEEEKSTLLIEQTSVNQQPYEEQPPLPVNMRSLHNVIIPATADNSPARNIVVPSANRSSFESQIADTHNILTTA